MGSSLGVHGSGRCASTARGPGCDPRSGTKILPATLWPNKQTTTRTGWEDKLEHILLLAHCFALTESTSKKRGIWV